MTSDHEKLKKDAREAREREKRERLAKLPAIDPAQRYTIPEAIDYLRTSRSTIYAKINAGEIRTRQVGKRRYVPGTELIAQSRPSA